MKTNSLIVGSLVGLLVPATAISLYFLATGENRGIIDSLAETQRIRLLAPLLSLAVLPNLAVFYLLLQRNRYQSVRGVILATLFYALTIVFLKFGM